MTLSALQERVAANDSNRSRVFRSMSNRHTAAIRLERLAVLLALCFAAARGNAQTGPNWTALGIAAYQQINDSLGVGGASMYAESASLSGSQSGGSDGTAYAWPLSTMLRVDDSLAMLSPVEYDPVLQSLSDQFYNEYWNASTGGYRSGAAAGSTVFYDDNAHIAVALAQAYQITGNPVYLTRAEQTEAYVLSGSDGAAGGGIYWDPGSAWKDAISTLQGARGAALIYEVTGQSSYLSDATSLYNWAATHIQLSNGLYYQQYQISSGSATGTPIVNSAGDGISLNIQMYKATGTKSYLTEAESIANTALSSYFNSSTGAINDEGYWAFELADGLLDLYQIDHNAKYLSAVEGGMQYLYYDMQDTNGHYGTYWGRGGPLTGTTLSSWDLNNQAPVARAYLYLGQALTPTSSWTLAGGGSWSGTANWAGVAPPNGDGANVYLQLPTFSSSPLKITLDGQRTVGTIYLADTATATSGYNITSGTTGGAQLLVLSNMAGAAQLVVTSGSQAISAPVSLASSLAISLSSGSALAISGNIAGTGKSLTLAYGGGLLVLGGSNTYSGGTTVSSGVLRVANSSALGPANGSLTTTGGTLDLNNYSLSVGSLAGSYGTILSSSGASSVLTLNQAAGASTYGGILANGGGTLGFTKSGGGTLVLTSSNTYSGRTLVSGGTLQLDGGILGFGGNGSGWTLKDSTGGFPVAVTGNVATLTTANNSEANAMWYNAQVPVVGGAWTAGFTYTNASGNGADGGAFVIQTAGTKSLGNDGGSKGLSGTNGSYTPLAQSAAFVWNIYSGNGGSEVGYLTGGSASPGTATGNGVNLDAAVPVNFTLSYDGTSALHVTAVQGVNSWTQTYSVALGSALKNPANGLAYIGFVGGTGGVNALQQISDFSFSTFASLGSVLQAASPVQVAGGALLDLNGGNQQVASLSGGGSVVNSDRAFPSVLTLSPSGGSSTFSGTIRGGGTLGALALVLDGSGTEVLSGTNSYTGDTTVDAGTLIIADAAALPDGGNLIVGAAGASMFGSVAGSSSTDDASAASAVPEPETLALLLAAGIVAAVVRRTSGTVVSSRLAGTSCSLATRPTTFV